MGGEMEIREDHEHAWAGAPEQPTDARPDDDVRSCVAAALFGDIEALPLEPVKP